MFCIISTKGLQKYYFFPIYRYIKRKINDCNKDTIKEKTVKHEI